MKPKKVEANIEEEEEEKLLTLLIMNNVELMNYR